MAGRRVGTTPRYRSRILRRRPPSAPKAPWWKAPRTWIVTLLAAGVAGAVTPAVTHVVNGTGERIRHAAGLTAPVPAPISMTVTSTAGELSDCQSWAFTTPVTQVPFHQFSPTDYTANQLWALGAGGVDEGAGAYTITVQGTSGTATIIRDIRVRVLSRAPARTGPVIATAVGCGGNQSIRTYDTDFTAANPVTTLVDPAGASAKVHQEYRVTQSDTESLVMVGYFGYHQPVPPPYFYTFVYELDWSQGASTGTVEIRGPDGKPFGLTAYAPGSRTYLAQNNTWTDINPGQ